MTSIADGELFFVKAAHGLASGANITELTGSTGSYGIGSGTPLLQIRKMLTFLRLMASQLPISQTMI